MMDGNTPTSLREALELVKSHDFHGALSTMERLDDTHDKRWAYIQFVAEQVKIGDLEGAKETVHAAPALWTGGHWVRCLLGPLVKSGDIEGAFGIVARLTDPGMRGFHKRVILALQTMAGDLSGARDTLESITPEEGHRDRALSMIAEAEVRMDDFEGAIKTAFNIAAMDYRGVLPRFHGHIQEAHNGRGGVS